MTEVTNSLGTSTVSNSIILTILPTITPATENITTSIAWGNNQSPVMAIVLASCITFILIVILVIVVLSLVARYLKRKEMRGKYIKIINLIHNYADTVTNNPAYGQGIIQNIV